MLDTRRQFRVLYRDFLARIVDLELVSAGGAYARLWLLHAPAVEEAPAP